MQLQNKIISIYGLPGSGKTFFAMFLASFYPRIYSNVDLYRNGVKMSRKISEMRDLNAIKFEKEKGVAILDESGINISSRRSSSNANLDFLEMGMLSRKKNVDIILISQLERSLDVVMRELCKYSFIMDTAFDKSHNMIFKATIKGRFDFLIGEKEFDLIKFANLTGWHYETKDESKIDRSNKDEKKETKKNFKDILNFADNKKPLI